MIPELDADGFLPEGIWRCTGNEFLTRFSNGDSRKQYKQTILNILDYAAHHGAPSVLVGGSFVTNKKSPADFDSVILFANETQIPPRIESLNVGENSIDIFFASEDQPELVKSFIKLFSTNKFGKRTGLIEIQIINKGEFAWDITWEPDDEIHEVVRRAYINRHFIDKVASTKTLVTIHGLRTHAEWNAEVTLCASANGWTVAPFQYGYKSIRALIGRSQRQQIVDHFRKFLTDVERTFGADNISVVAHSFGTYIACRYVLGFDEPPIRFDTLIMCGAIVNQDLDFDSFEGRVGKVLNEVAPNDGWANWAQKVNFGRDELFGTAGSSGFSSTSSRLTQRRSDIFTHNNVISRDVITHRWLPYLEANKGLVEIELLEKMKKRISMNAF